jgi:hypothetical protein
MKLSDIRALSVRSRKFEELLAEVFRLEGFEVSTEISGGNMMYAADLLITSGSGAKAIVEAKLYASRNMPISAVMDGIRNAEGVRRALGVGKAIFAVAIRISEAVKEEASKRYPAVSIYDVNALTFLFGKHQRLQERFEELIRESMTFSDTPIAKPERVDVTSDVDDAQLDYQEVPSEQPETPKGAQLCLKLQGLVSGQGQAKLFEATMTEALKYIFQRELLAWASQKKSNSGMSFFDLVARVNSEHDFWRAIVNHFQSRYVVFEFKNYRKRIKQGQILTTEKYLYRTALRSTAIIISKVGADKNAMALCRGVLREHGKLIINLTVEDICAMLQMRDEATDHNSVLTDYVDKMLMELEP